MSEPRVSVGYPWKKTVDEKRGVTYECKLRVPGHRYDTGETGYHLGVSVDRDVFGEGPMEERQWQLWRGGGGIGKFDDLQEAIDAAEEALRDHGRYHIEEALREAQMYRDLLAQIGVESDA